MRLYLFILVYFSFCPFIQAQENSFLGQNTTPTYDELIQFYQNLALSNQKIQLYNMGKSDFGKPIYLCILNGEEDSTATFKKARANTTILINNAIHPGEPCGVNACMELALDYSLNADSKKNNFPLVAIIPAYNVGGMHNRSSTSRANQEGPLEYGFRGNAKNLDLNRDFIKMDSRNARTFATIFHSLDPDIFIDTHTSNGADYPYTLTYIAPTFERMDPTLRALMYDELIPYLNHEMENTWNTALIPYVSMNSNRLDGGIHAFNTLPRYSMGYTDLFQTLSFTTEAHMLKPFPDRVKSTYGFINSCINWTLTNQTKLEKARVLAKEKIKLIHSLPVNLALDTSQIDSIYLKGYEWTMLPSKLTNQPRLFYDRTKPKDEFLPYYFNYHSTDSIKIPGFYIIGQQELEIIELLRLNGVTVVKSAFDTTLDAMAFKIVEYESSKRPFEGHYLHSNTKVEEVRKVLTIKRGDFIIPCRQQKLKFIINVLDPRFEDSYFSWNYFDSYIQQKEYFSSYVFEEKAIEILNNNAELKSRYEEKKRTDIQFSSDRYAQLNFIYANSEYVEPSLNISPIFFVYE